MANPGICKISADDLIERHGNLVVLCINIDVQPPDGPILVSRGISVVGVFMEDSSFIVNPGFPEAK